MFSYSKKTILTSIFILALAVVLGIGTFRVMEKISANGSVSQNTTVKEETNRVVNEENVVIDVVQKAKPSVVSIAIESQVVDFFGRPLSSQSQESGIGTGFILSQDGFILTNKHVVSDTSAKYFVLIKQDGAEDKKYEVTQINSDPFNDLSIIKIDATGLKPIELGDSSNLKVGQTVIAIGNALGRLDNTVTTGVISGLGRGVSPVDPSTGIAESLSDLIQTDAAINPGNSGGPLLNSSGQVIGINSAMASAENIGFAIPINTAKELYSNFKQNGKISRPLLGVRYSHVTGDLSTLSGAPEGEEVKEVVSGSSADKAGVKVGDIIIKIDGAKMTEEQGLSEVIKTKKIGDKMKLTIWRDGKTFDVEVTLGEAS